jgi:hypothetical protein
VRFEQENNLDHCVSEDNKPHYLGNSHFRLLFEYHKWQSACRFRFRFQNTYSLEQEREQAVDSIEASDYRGKVPSDRRSERDVRVKTASPRSMKPGNLALWYEEISIQSDMEKLSGEFRPTMLKAYIGF